MASRRPSAGSRTLVRALVFVLALPALAVAQPAQTRGTITGRITAADNGQPLQGASVVVMETTLGALARADGTYRLLLPPGRYRLNTRLIGYTTETREVTLRAGETLRLDVALKRAPQSLAQVAVVGTRRSEERVVTSAPVPVDVISAEEIKQTGRTETAQILQMLVPSLNFPRSSIAGGVDGQRPFTLRGMNPDQVLVLINGKRRHIGSVVAVNNSVGRGSSGVDLNAIPASSIERIEVLRDGAAAQYGSDAIAGVVNIVLKKNAPAQFSSTLGRVASTLSGPVSPTQGSVRYSDGGVTQVDGNYSWSLGDNGYLNIGAEYRDRGLTNRNAPDLRQQYFNDATIAPDRLALTRNNAWYGDAALREGGLMFNAGSQFRNGVEWYAFGGGFRRQSQAFGFPRRPLERTVVRSIWPNGFLPEIWGTSTDASGTAGFKGRLGKWNWDASAQYGGNRFRFDLENTNNPTLGNASPTEFYAGQLEATIAQVNADFNRSFDIRGFAGPLNMAFGAEGRREGYRIIEGEPGSYIDGGVRVLDGPEAGQPTVSGSQLFYGFRPVDARRPRRTSNALYLDFEAQPWQRLTVGLAGRREQYSDFGEATIGKVTSRVDLGAGWAVRGAYNTGFRAPTLGQANYRATASNVLIINGVPTPNEALTLATNEPAAIALGATPLRPEKSRNLSAGLTYNPSRTFTATVDWFRIDVDDRIVLSENFTGAGVQRILANNGITGVDIRPRFFTNAVDTRTQGVDVVVRYLADLGPNRTLNLTAGYNHNRVELLRIASAPQALVDAGQTQLFGRVERSRLVEAQPRNSFRGNLIYSQDKWTVNVQQAFFGSVISRSNLTAVPPAGTTNPQDLLSWRDPGDQTFGGRWITDVSVGYQVDPKFLLTIGADNIFDVYPDRISVNNPDNFGGTRLFNPFSPFGANGRFLFARVTYSP